MTCKIEKTLTFNQIHIAQIIFLCHDMSADRIFSPYFYLNKNCSVPFLGPKNYLTHLDLESSIEDFFGLGTTDGAVDGDFFVTSDTESSDGVTGL